MPSEFELTISRYQTFLRDVLDPAVCAESEPLSVGVHQLPPGAAMTPEVAFGAAYTPVTVGWRWGPKWSTAWFRVRGEIPASHAGRASVLRFSSGTEALVWGKHGTGEWEPVQGLDVNRDRLPLADPAAGAETIDVLIEAACNHPFGVLGFEWDPPDTHARWQSDAPGLLERCEVAVFDHALWRLRHSYAFALGLLKELPRNSSRAQDLYGALRRATNAARAVFQRAAGGPPVPMLDPEGVIAAQRVLDEALARKAPGSAARCIAVGHAHIDTAWLWTIAETKRKLLRTFSTQLRLMESDPGYVFLCSQAQQYDWVRERSPALFAQIKARVEEGRWEPGGGMWIEPDANCPSGESLARQILHGTRFWESQFGERGRQSFLYLPDTFGFPASLPQIMARAGLHTFITNKMVWNRVNTFPHTTFVWRGIDGSEVIGHNTPGHDYNAVNTPKELARGEANHLNRDRAPEAADGTRGAVYLQPFGYGDGGGGPTDWSILYARLARDCDGLPRVTLGRADEFCRGLIEHAAAVAGTPEELPTWWGELYLEIHRGTLTTQAWIKEANRRAEEALRLAELLTFAGPRLPEGATEASAKLDKAWKTLLLNQFHDILPGSSIGPVYEDARRDFARIAKTTESLIDRGTTAWLAGLSTIGASGPIGVFNPCSVERSGVIDLDDGPVFARAVPALGVAVIDRAAPHGCVPASAREGPEGTVVLSNGLIRVEVDGLGRVSSLRREGGGRELCGPDGEGGTLPLNQLVLYEDVPHMWDAWDIDPTYEDKASPVEHEPETIEIVEDGPLRAAVRVTRTMGRSSRIVQTYVIEAASPRLDILTTVDWRESRALLRAIFPTSVVSPRATYEIQFGHIERPTRRNSSWDAAKFEVCAHRWMDLSEPGAGLALLNDGKYGHSCHEGVMGLSLLRSPHHPDAGADVGSHEFTYSLMPHDGDWRAAGVDREAEALNTPLIAYPLNPDEEGPLGRAWSPIELVCNGSAGVAVSAFKLAEDGKGLVLRLWECRGGRGTLSIRWNLPAGSVRATDLLERDADGEGLSHSGGVTTVPLRPFQIVTLRSE